VADALPMLTMAPRFCAFMLRTAILHICAWRTDYSNMEIKCCMLTVSSACGIPTLPHNEVMFLVTHS
jgi:hypothetical protein